MAIARVGTPGLCFVTTVSAAAKRVVPIGHDIGASAEQGQLNSSKPKTLIKLRFFQLFPTQPPRVVAPPNMCKGVMD